MSRYKAEDGSILIMTMVTMLVVIGFSAMAFDMGVLFVGRGGAQNAADAGALAGAVARAFDEPGVASGSLATSGATIQSILTHSEDPRLLGTNDHTVEYDFNCPAVAPAGAECVRVDVYRDGGTFRDGSANGSVTLPTFFANAFGIGSQTTRATATAMSAVATGSNCLKPWLIPDKWTELGGDPNRFDLNIDDYAAPGWTLADVGTVVTLNPGSPHQAAAPSMFYQVDVNNYYDDIVGCELVKGIGETIDTAPGLSNGLTRNGVGVLTADGPVTVVIGMFSPVEFEQNRQTGHYTMTIVNMMGFRIEGMTGNSLYGTLVSAPGDIIPGATTPSAGATFLKAIRLIQ